MRMMRLTTVARTGRRMKMSVNFMAGSAVLRLRRELRSDLHIGVVDGDARAVAQLERAGADELLTRLHAVDNGDEVAAGFAELDELLPGDLDRLSVRPGDDLAGVVLLVL